MDFFLCFEQPLRASHLLIELEPRHVAFAVCVLQAEEPDLPQTDCFHHLKPQIYLMFSTSSSKSLKISPTPVVSMTVVCTCSFSSFRI